jgi:mono/diheme cytochrome c family protein
MVAHVRVCGAVLMITLAVGFVSSGSLAQVSTGQPGEAAYAGTCASCHGGASALTSRLGALNNPARIAQLDRFLTRHHARNAEQRRALIDYLASVSRR